jgi:antitoxin MazE
MDLDLINIGNSKGIRLPKALIEACGFKDTIHVDLKDGQLILSAQKPPRHNWSKLLKEAISQEHEEKDDLKDFQEFTNKFDDDDWTW